MLKTGTLVVLTIVIMISFAGFVYWWLSNYANELSEAISELYFKLDNDKVAAVSDITAIKEYWEENQHLLYYVIDHAEVDAIHLHILRAEEWLKRGCTQEAAVEIRELHHLIYYLPTNQGLNMEGIL